MKGKSPKSLRRQRGFWNFFIQLAVVAILGYIFRPKPPEPPQAPDPAGINDLKLPTVTHGRAVPVLFGTDKIQPNMVIAHNFRNQEILGNGTYYYYLRMQLALCLGPIRQLTAIFTDEEKTQDFGNTLRFADGGFAVLPVGLPLEVSKNVVRVPEGMPKFAATAGKNNLEVYRGGPDDHLNSDAVIETLLKVQGFIDIDQDYQSYNGTANVVFDGFIGLSPNVPRLAFEAGREPNIDSIGVNALEYNDEYTSNLPILPGVTYGTAQFDVNPTHVLLELMTNQNFGAGISSSFIRIPSFTTDVVDPTIPAFDPNIPGSGVLFRTAEGNGALYLISFIMENPKEYNDVIEQILRMFNAVLRPNALTGQIELYLVRSGQVIGALRDALPVVDDSVIKEVVKYQPGSWEDTINEVRVEYMSRAKNYKIDYEVAQDLANYTLRDDGQGPSFDSVTRRYHMIKRGDIAQRVASQELAELSVPRAKMKLRLQRRMLARAVAGTEFDNFDTRSLREGDPFIMYHEDPGGRFTVDDVVYRVTAIDDRPTEFIEIDVVEAIVGTRQNIFDPQPTLSVPPQSSTELLVDDIENVGGTPLNFRCVTTAGTSITLRWDVTNTTNTYRLTTLNLDQSIRSSVSLAANTPQATVSGLVNATTYIFQIFTINPAFGTEFGPESVQCATSGGGGGP